MEYFPSDLRSEIEKTLDMGSIKSYAQGLFSGLYALYLRNIIHRDIKPQNLLVSDGVLKIADFGLARKIAGSNMSRQLTQEVVTLWYRAPEIILGARNYSQAIDIWSAGCVLGEMVSGTPVFDQKTEYGMFIKQCQIMGSPNPETWTGLGELQHWTPNFPKLRPQGFPSVLEQRPEFGEQGVDLLNRTLCMDPPERLLASTAKNHDFFQS